MPPTSDSPLDPPSLAAGIQKAGLASSAQRPLCDLAGQCPELLAPLAAADPWLRPALETLAAGFPLPPAVTPFVAPPFYRPPGSLRCFYYAPFSLLPAARSGGVVAFKGIEPLASDVEVLLGHLRRPCYSPHDMAEHLVFEEHKIPACLSLPEALREAERARDIQRAHLSAYGTLARLPVPLFVYRHADETAWRMLLRLRNQLSSDACDALEERARDGLGVYVYYYSGPPIRVRDLDYLLAGWSFDRRAAALPELCDPDRVVTEWIRTFVRMLYLGVLPGSLASLRTGIVCQPQNACLDGGFVDLDSLTPVGELASDAAIAAALQFSLDSLRRSVRTLLAGSTNPVREEPGQVRVDLHYLDRYVWAQLERALGSEARPGLTLDARIRRYLEPAASSAQLLTRLCGYYGGGSREFERASRGFAEFGAGLFARLVVDQRAAPGAVVDVGRAQAQRVLTAIDQPAIDRKSREAGAVGCSPVQLGSGEQQALAPAAGERQDAP